MSEFEELFNNMRENTDDATWVVKTTPELLLYASIISGFDISDLEIIILDDEAD